MLYDEVHGEIYEKPPMNSARFGHALVGDNSSLRVYAFGGADTSTALQRPLCVAEMYDCTTEQWEALPSIPKPLHHVSGTRINITIYLVARKEERIISFCT
jgi:hypothetical protein